MKVKLKCKICGKVIETFPCRIGIKKFCSNKCRGAWRHKIHGIVWIKRTCPICKKKFLADQNQVKRGYYKFCGNKCRYEFQRGANSPVFKGGYVRPDGYREVSHDGRRWLEHDLNYFLYTGIKPNKQMQIHHIDRNKLNNDISNLELIQRVGFAR